MNVHATLEYVLAVGIVSDEDATEVWEASSEEAINKVRKKKTRSSGAGPYILDEEKVERTFWLTRPDG